MAVHGGDLIDHFLTEIEITYREETYVVRDNGAVLRKTRPDMRKRLLDELWTFGLPNRSTGYMHFGAEVVHRIVATAYHGGQPSEKHVVDHVDTNRRNNRPENLRWVTRLENILLNSVTRQRIELAYGSIEAFLENPQAPVRSKVMEHFQWMRTVTKEEAQEAGKRLRTWAASGKYPTGGNLGEWIYAAGRTGEVTASAASDLPSLTRNAVQRNWKTPTEFLLCPAICSPDALKEYESRLKFGAVFAAGRYGSSSTVVAQAEDDVLSVICNLAENPIKDWALTKVTVEDGKFVHESLGSFFTLQHALKRHCSVLNISFEDSIDDYA
jgi:hypothetical protein